MSIFDKILGDPNEKEIKKLQQTVDKINAQEEDFKKFSEEQLKKETQEFKKRLKEGESLDDILDEAFALVREAAKRTLNQRHYDVQLMGGIVLHQGSIAEMKTGEGKTLASTTAVYLNALSGKGAHLITVNDYLAKRDAVWMGQIYHALGLSVGIIANQQESYIYDPSYKLKDEQEREQADEERDTLGAFKVEDEFLRPVDRADAYKADITYGTNNEFGFDYLRDNLVQKKENKVQRGHNFAIVDEIDSILIDEARTPLIISAPDAAATEIYKTFSRIVPQLKEGADYNVDFKLKAVSILEPGIEKVEKALGITNLYDPAEGGGIKYVHQLEQALKAQILFTRDKDYVVKEGEIIIVDEFTGRLMPGRRYSEGLHQAIEAKEGVKVQQESRTLASITFQNYFRMYDKLSGMTGTAVTSAEEFDRVYKLQIVVVPTNKTLIRKELPDLIFRTEEGKFKALLADIKKIYETGQPILIGTTSIEKNERLSAFLQKEGIKHELLNAKNHEQEGAIIAQAGRLKAVTVATNMAGRGVDIILGGNPPDEAEAKKVRDLGGLHVIATERHEARRIDNQLRGRAGRQGDPGSSRFYLSLEDEIMRVFGGERIKSLMERLNVPEDQPIESGMVSKSVESAQSKIEGMHFDSRKRLLDYDEVLNKHRETIYKRRNEILEAKDKDIKKRIKDSLEAHFNNLFEVHLAANYAESWNLEELFEEIKTIAPVEDSLHKEFEQLAKEHEHVGVLREKIKERALNAVFEIYKEKEQQAGEENMRRVERWLMLRTIDVLWTDHLDALGHMRDSVKLRAYAQRDPLVEYKNEGLRMFKQLLAAIEADVVSALFKLNIDTAPAMQEQSLNDKAQNQGGQISKRSEATGGGLTPDSTDSSSTKLKDKIGRNDPCPCGSGKKYKKCGMINAPEHKA